MTINELDKTFWCATHYYRAPSPPPQEWATDLASCRGMGLELVQVRVFWRWHERHEGVYFWDDLDLFMRTAAEAGCRVVFQFCLECAPEFIFRDYDGYRVDIRGSRIWPISNAAFYAGGWIPCFDNPDVMQCALRFVEKTVERYKGNPSLAFYHAWNEPRCRPMGECACPHSVESFRLWLAERFGTVEAYNAATGKCLGDFSQADAARDTSDFTDMFLWRQWGASRVRDRVEKVTRLLRAIDPARAVISHVGMASVIQDPLSDISDDIQMADVTDMYGISFPTRAMPEYTGYMLEDWMRYASHGHFSVYELYPSMGQYLPDVPPDMLQQWIWSTVATGAHGLCFWQYKKERLGVEVDDAGIVEMDGSWNDTSRVVAESVRELSRLASDIAHWKVPRAKAALVYDLPCDLENRLEFTIARDGDYVGNYNLRSRVPGEYPYKGDVDGFYHLFWRQNIPVDFTTPRRWRDDLCHYRVVFLPCFAVLDDDEAEQLAGFVEQGGCLVVDAGFGRRGATTIMNPVRPGAGLAARFGFRERRCSQLNGSVNHTTILGVKDVAAQFERVEYEIVGPQAEIIGTWDDNGKAAAVKATCGKGVVFAIGALPGLDFYGDEHGCWDNLYEACGHNAFKAGNMAPWTQVFDKILETVGIAPESRWNHPGVIERRLVDDSDGSEILVALRRFDGGHKIAACDWQKLDVPGSVHILALENVHVWRTQRGVSNQN